jgi:hypothetical protein
MAGLAARSQRADGSIGLTAGAELIEEITMPFRRTAVLTAIATCMVGTLVGCGTTAEPASRPTAAVPSPSPSSFPTTADAYTSALVQAWQKPDIKRLTALAGPKITTFLMSHKAPRTVAGFRDVTGNGRTSVHVVGDPSGREIDVTVDYIDSGLGRAHAIIDIVDTNAGRTIAG